MSNYYHSIIKGFSVSASKKKQQQQHSLDIKYKVKKILVLEEI